MKYLKDVTFKVKPNELTAIVGRSGSGKVLIDKEDIYNYTNDVYKTNVSVVTQKSILFNMSIKDNLTLVEPNLKKCQEVCDSLGIHDEILNLPKTHTVIIITHKKDVMNKADHLIVIDKGKKVVDGSPKSLEDNKYYLNLRDSSSVSSNNF